MQKGENNIIWGYHYRDTGDRVASTTEGFFQLWNLGTSMCEVLPCCVSLHGANGKKASFLIPVPVRALSLSVKALPPITTRCGCIQHRFRRRQHSVHGRVKQRTAMPPLLHGDSTDNCAPTSPQSWHWHPSTHHSTGLALTAVTPPRAQHWQHCLSGLLGYISSLPIFTKGSSKEVNKADSGIKLLLLSSFSKASSTLYFQNPEALLEVLKLISDIHYLFVCQSIQACTSYNGQVEVRETFMGIWSSCTVWFPVIKLRSPGTFACWTIRLAFWEFLDIDEWGSRCRRWCHLSSCLFSIFIAGSETCWLTRSPRQLQSKSFILPKIPVNLLLLDRYIHFLLLGHFIILRTIK